MQLNIIGAGLAGCEAALWLADRGVQVELYEQKPTKYSPAHKSAGFAELICSNSLKAERPDSASGLLAAHQIYARLQGRELPPPPVATMCGALLDYITTPNKDFQPMGANMGILPRTEEINAIRDKRERYMALSQAAQDAMRAWTEEYKA